MQDRISRSKNKKIITVSHFHLYFKCSSQNFTKNNKNIQAFELPLVIWSYVKLKKSNWNKYIFIYHTTLGNNYFKIRINSMSKLFPLNDFENGALLSFTYGHLYKSNMPSFLVSNSSPPFWLLCKEKYVLWWTKYYSSPSRKCCWWDLFIYEYYYM